MGIRLLQIRAQPAVLFYRLTYFWGLFLLLPFNTFQNPIFTVMHAYAPEWFWGALVFGVGIRLRSAVNSKRTKRIRDALFGIMVLWLFITTMLCVASSYGTNWVVYPLLTYYMAREYLIYSVRYSVLKQETEEFNVSN